MRTIILTEAQAGELAKQMGEQKPICYIMCGIPGSGKSTWIKNNLPVEIPIVSRDIIRAELGMSKSADDKFVGSREQEQEVTKHEYDKIRELANTQQDFVIDDTNTGQFRAPLIDFVRSFGYSIYGINLHTDVETCIQRREGQIPEDVMRKINAKIRFIDPSEVDKVFDV